MHGNVEYNVAILQLERGVGHGPWTGDVNSLVSAASALLHVYGSKSPTEFLISVEGLSTFNHCYFPCLFLMSECHEREILPQL